MSEGQGDMGVKGIEKPWFAFWPKLLPRTLEYPVVPLFEFAETSARRFPNKAALIFYGRTISYGELWESIERFAGYLHSVGVRRGDRVALYLQNSPHFVVSYFGTLRSNAIAVPINPMLVDEELAKLLADSGVKVIVTTGELLPRVLRVKNHNLHTIIAGQYLDYLPGSPDLPVPDFMKVEYDLEGAVPWQQAVGDRQPPEVEVSYSDLALLVYTGGTTGTPKGCMHTHSTATANVLSSVYWLVLTPASISLATLPLYHVTGMVHSMLAPIYAGGTLVLLARWDRDTAISAIEKYKCTHWVTITTMVVDLLGAEDVKHRDLSSLLVVQGGGAAMPKAVAERFEEVTGLKYLEGYGLTETMAQTHWNPPERPKYQSIGIPDFGVEALIVEVGSGRILPPGSEGELVLKGPELFKGYWNRPEETRKAFIEINGEKYFRTGDLCYMDEEGYFYVVDRLKRMINRAGFKVWPAEIEAVLYRHPAVREACVVGVPDDRVGEEVKAYIVLDPAYEDRVTEEQLVAWAKEHMAAYKYPRAIEFVKELPKSGAGKILWRVLQDKARASKPTGVRCVNEPC